MTGQEMPTLEDDVLDGMRFLARVALRDGIPGVGVGADQLLALIEMAQAATLPTPHPDAIAEARREGMGSAAKIAERFSRLTEEQARSIAVVLRLIAEAIRAAATAAQRENPDAR